MEDWAARSLENCEQPEDWMGPFDDLGPEDIGLPEVSVETRGSGIAMDRALRDIEERGSPPRIPPRSDIGFLVRPRSRDRTVILRVR